MTNNDLAIWQQLAATNQKCIELADTFFKKTDDRVSMIRRGLHGTVAETMLSIGLLRGLEPGEREQIFRDLVPLCLSQKFGSSAREALLTLFPREWIIAHIEESLEPRLQNADNLDYSMAIGVLKSLDPALALRLGQRASVSDDFDIREVGEDYLRSIAS